MGSKTVIENKLIEECVIAALLIDYDDCSEALEILNPECFYDSLCRKLYETITDMSQQGKDIDLYSVSANFKEHEKIKIVDITMRVASALHVLHHARLLYELHCRRKLNTLSIKIEAKNDNNTPVDSIISEIEQEIQCLFKFDTSSVSRLSDVMDNVFRIMFQNNEGKENTVGMKTGLTEFDRFSSGLQLTDLVIIAGESGNGKTSLALTFARNIAKQGVGIAFYSLEMSKEQLTARLMAQESEVSSKEILTQKMEVGKIEYINQATMELSNSNIYFDDKHTTRLESILNSIRYLKRKFGIKIAIVDYLQLVSAEGKGFNREQQIATIARAFKNIAKDLNMCIILLSQLSRNGANHIPTLSRLRDSGQIEEAADIVVFTYSAEQSKDNAYPAPFENYDIHNTAMIDIAKGRNIGTTQFMVTYKKSYVKFIDYEGNKYDEINKESDFFGLG